MIIHWFVEYNSQNPDIHRDAAKKAEAIVAAQECDPSLRSG
jgi:hypothetical protein